MKKDVKEDIQGQAPYKVDKLSKIPRWLVFLLLKFWAAAAAVFFSSIGGLDVGLDFSNVNEQDPMAILNATIIAVIMIGLFLCLLMNYIVRPIARLMYNRRCNTYKYNMVNCKGILSFFLNFFYCMFLSIILCFVTYFLSMHGLVLDPFGTTGGQGIEPITYGLCFVVVDFIFLFIKNLIIYIYNRIKYQKQSSMEV